MGCADGESDVDGSSLFFTVGVIDREGAALTRRVGERVAFTGVIVGLNDVLLLLVGLLVGFLVGCADGESEVDGSSLFFSVGVIDREGAALTRRVGERVGVTVSIPTDEFSSSKVPPVMEAS